MPIEFDPKKQEQWRLESLRLAHSAGLAALLQTDVGKWADQLSSSDSAEVREEFAWFEREAQRCALIEAEHGKGCLLNLEHEFVRRSMEGTRVITPEEFEAARRYRRTMGQAA